MNDIESPELSVVLPFFNEEGAVRQVIETLLDTLRQGGASFEIVAVQNGSSDRTSEILAGLRASIPELVVVQVAVNRGFGMGIIEGLAVCRGALIGYMPGDGQIEPQAVLSVKEQIRLDGTEIGQGFRAKRADGWHRVFVSAVYNFLVALLFGRQLGDMNGHPKLFSHRVYKQMNLRSQDNFVDAEILLKASRMGLRVSVVALEFKKRETGRSAVRASTCLEFLRNLLEARFSQSDRWGINKLGKVTDSQQRI